MTKDHEQALRRQLVELLAGGGAHAKFEDVVKNLPAKLRAARPVNFPHSSWMILEHLRLAQWDILEFSRNPKHVSPEWPTGYWPKTPAPPNSTAWSKSVKACQADDCHWAFYDSSRNRSGRWCDMAVCGNREKVRAYRSKRSASSRSRSDICRAAAGRDRTRSPDTRAPRRHCRC